MLQYMLNNDINNWIHYYAYTFIIPVAKGEENGAVNDLNELYAIVLTGYILDAFRENRIDIKNLVEAHSLLVPQSVMDSLDSYYKPFITGVKRKPTTDLNQFTSLVGTLIVLKASVKQTTELVEVYTYFIEELEKHLKDPAYDEVKAEYFETLKNTRDSIDEVLNGSI